MSVITVSLLHPTQPIAVQSWTFEPTTTIRIGRSQDNDVVVYSAVVSRHHVELRRQNEEWEIISFGSNGTYVNNELITHKSVTDGMIMRLGNSGPKIQIRFGMVNPHAKVKKAGQSAVLPDSERGHPTFLTGQKNPQEQEQEEKATNLDL